MLLLERQGETINDRAENLKQFGNAVKSLGLVYKLEEDVVDRSAYI